VWVDFRSSGKVIFFAASNDNGQNFSILNNLSNNPERSNAPTIASSGSNVYVVWKDFGDIFFAASNDNGQTFNAPAKNLSNDTGASTSPQISSSVNNVYVVWEDTIDGDRDEDIFFAASDDKGQTFSTPAKNLSNNAVKSKQPQISSSGNNVYVVWQDLAPGNHGVLFASSADSRTTFSSPAKNLGTTLGGSSSPQISSSENNVYVVWSDITPAGNRDIFFAAVTDKGQTFSAVRI
jgi:hypothetical protein